MNDYVSVVLRKVFTPRSIVWVALFSWAGLVWSYINATGPFLVSRDQFRFLRIVEAYHTGSLGWQEFFTSHSEHVKPAYLFFFYLNSIILDLNIKAELFLGLIALCLAALVVVGQYRRSMEEQRSELFIAITSLILVSQLFSFNQRASFGFSLLMFGGYAQLFLFLMIFRLADDLWLRRKDYIQLVKLVTCIFVATFTFAGARMPVVVLSLLMVPILLFMLGSGEHRRLLNQGGVIFLAGGMALGIYKLLSATPGRNAGGVFLERVSENPLELWMFFTSAISASVLPAMYFRRNYEWWAADFAAVGTVLLLLMLLVVFVYLRSGLWRQSLMPIMMVFYGWGFVAAVSVARYGSGFPIQTAWSPRYVFDTQIAVVGIIWMLLLWIGQGEKMKGGRVSALVILGALVVGFQAAVATDVWNNAKYVARTWERAETRMRSEVEKPGSVEVWPRWYCPNDELCRQGAQILFQYRLNLFAGQPVVESSFGGGDDGRAASDRYGIEMAFRRNGYGASDAED